jgi:VIT1/CCC1 family predicted Fe2+/Mn2+ transporter
MGFLKELLSGGAGDLVNAVGNVVDNVSTTKEEKMQLELERQKAEMQFQVDMAKLSSEERQMYLQDTQGARQMAVGVQTSDAAPWLAKHISTILAMGTTVLTFLLFYFVIFKRVTSDMNKELIYYILGVLSAIVTQIFSFYFGSSQGSADKHRFIKDITDRGMIRTARTKEQQ